MFYTLNKYFILRSSQQLTLEEPDCKFNFYCVFLEPREEKGQVAQNWKDKLQAWAEQTQLTN